MQGERKRREWGQNQDENRDEGMQMQMRLANRQVHDFTE
jgi:hypothetical protein